jgi:hypothetical protein
MYHHKKNHHMEIATYWPNMTKIPDETNFLSTAITASKQTITTLSAATSNGRLFG